MESYHVLEMIGEGSFGRVYKGRKKFSRQVVALKFIPKVGKSEMELRSLKREIDIMRGLRHPNVILLLDSFETDREVVVVTEYAEGELFQILEDDGSLPERQVQVIACQLLSALYYLHSHRILHRDMKPQNILLGKGGVVKLCDFGFARAMSVSTLVLTSIKGTPLYMSPELVEEKPYDHTSDLWSLGCILYELHTGAPPFYTNSVFQLVQLIVQHPVKWPDGMSPDCMSFLKGLLTKDPRERLSWPDLLEHPFVADGVLVLPDSNPDNPLTVTPSPDLQALKLKQVKERTAPHSGEGRLLRKAREQTVKGRKCKEGFSENTQRVGRRDSSNQAPLRTTQDGKTPSSNCPVPGQELERPPSSVCLVQQSLGCEEQLDSKGQISRDYAREFPSIEVGPRHVVTAHHGDPPGLDQLRPLSEEIRICHSYADSSEILTYCGKDVEEDTDSDEEWQRLLEKTDPGTPTSATFDPYIVLRLKNRLVTSKIQLLDGMSEGGHRIRAPLKVLSNLLTLGTDLAPATCLTKELDLPHFLLDLIKDIMGSPASQQTRCVPVLGDIMFALIVYWEQHFNWGHEEKRLEEQTKALITILLHPSMVPLSPLAAAALTLSAYRGGSVVPLELCPDELMAVTERVLSGPAECLPLPWGWGLFDGFLALLLQTLSEQGSCPASGFQRSSLWRLLWPRVAIALKDSELVHVSLAGLHTFLSLVLSVFTRDPEGCVPIFSDSSSGCVETLAHLLSAESARLSLQSSKERPAQPWISHSHDSLAVISCHLLCFPFAQELPEETLGQILESYHSCDIVSRLLQLSSALPLPLLEVPLSLLCHLLLCDPKCSVPRFMAAAETLGFFRPCDSDSEARVPEGRTAAFLLAAFLQAEAFSSSAAELLALLSQVARLSLRPPLSLLNLDPSLLRSALAHTDQKVRVATCSLLGNLDPLLDQTTPAKQPLLSLFRDLIGQLYDQSVTVRRVVCRAVGTWLGLISKVGGCVEGRDDPAEGESLLQDSRGWAETALEAVPVLMALLWDSDPLVRRRCCTALGNLAVLRAGTEALLQCNGPSRLLYVACTDPRLEVREAAISSLCVFSLQDPLWQALVSLNASEKLNRLSQNSLLVPRYHWLINRLRPT